MKNFLKKCFAILLTVIIVFSVNTVSFAAAASSNVNTYAGQKITVKFEFKNIMCIDGFFSYTNPNLFSDVKFRIEGITSGYYNENEKHLAYYGAAPTNCTIYLDLTVASSAQIGQSCGITLKYEASADGNFPNPPVYEYDKTTVTIIEKLDPSALKSAISKAEKLKKNSYTPETWSVLESALNNAKTVLNTATTQNSLNVATQTLNNAINGLEKLPDYSELNSQIKIAEALKRQDYTASTWSVLEGALSTAKNTLTSKVQTEIDAAAKALKSAISGLVSIYEGKLKLGELNEQIAIAESLNANDYEVEGWDALTTALANAKKAQSSKLQPEIDSAAAALKNAIAALKKVDYSRLSAAIGAINDYFNNTELFNLLNNATNLLDEANGALTSRNQQTVDDYTLRLEELLTQIKQAVDKLANGGASNGDTVTALPDEKYCNVKSHKVWVILFWISFAINVVGGAMAFMYFRTKRTMATDDTPLVDYDITDDVN